MSAAASNRCLWAISLGLLLYAIFRAKLGYFTVDEVIYLFAADTFRTGGGLILANGFDRFSSVDLNWSHMLATGPHGLTSQYPAGSAVLFGYLTEALGTRGIILFNTFATIGGLFATRALALRLFGGEGLAFAATLLFLFGTFVVEYAFGYWPHMVSVLSVTLSLFLVLIALDREVGAFKFATLSGLALGAGMMFRLDTIFLLPVIGCVVVIAAKHPFRIFAGGIVGLLPALAVLVATNHAKFGSWNPISYGGSVLADYGSDLPFLAVGLVGFLSLFLLRYVKPRQARWLFWGAMVTGIVVVFTGVAPGLNKLAAAYGRGFLALIVDATTINDPRAGVVTMDDGTQLFWGLPKKALGQSLPWIGVVLALLTLGWRDRQRSVLIVLAFVFIWSLPFIMRNWHGGLGSNMRYLMPLIPALSALSAWILHQFMEKVSTGPRLLFVSGVAGWITSLAWMFWGPGEFAGAHQIMPVYVLAAVASVSLFAGRVTALAPVVLVLAGIGIGQSSFNGLSDAYISQARRLTTTDLSDLSKGSRVPRSSTTFSFEVRC